MPDLLDVIEERAQAPKVIEVDGQKTEEHSLADLVKAAQFVATSTAAANPGRGLRITRLVPPDAT